MISIIKVLFCFSLLCLAALVQVPALQYDFNLDSFTSYDYSPLYIVCFLLSIVFKNNYSFIAVALYLIAGIAGLPIFAFGGGWTYIFEPSFGYLLGLLPLSVVAFYTRQHWTEIGIRTFANRSILPLMGLVFAHLLGLAYLLLSGKIDQSKFLAMSVYPFIYDIFLAHLALIFVPMREE